MILLKTLKLKKKTIKRIEGTNCLINTSYTNYITNLLKNLPSELKTIKIKLPLKSFNTKSKILNINKNKLKLDLINYVIKINSTKTNTFLTITDSKGNLKLSFSSGQLGLKKRQKISQPSTLIQLLKKVFLKAKFIKNKTVGLQFKNVKPFHELIILKMLKSKIFIKSIRSYNLFPHNGCRPKKLKRFKQRTKRLSV